MTESGYTRRISYISGYVVRQGVSAVKLKLNRDAKQIAARAGLSLVEWSRRADVAVSTIKANINPAQQPNRRGYFSDVVAWKLVKAYAQAAGVNENDAYRMLIVEERGEES